MKSLFILLILPLFSYGQSCDTLYSHEKYVQRGVEVEYRNCHSIKIDSVYEVVQWENIDTAYLERYFFRNDCFSLYHSITRRLIAESWKVYDTTFVKSYYSNGMLKAFSKQLLTKDFSYFHQWTTEYYENGSIRSEGEYETSAFSEYKSYYPNGALETHGTRFSHNPHFFGEYYQYFPNGQLSSVLTYSEPDTTSNQYQSNTLLDEKYFDMSGQVVDHDLNEYRKMYIKINPPEEDLSFIIDDHLYTHHNFSEQKAYSNNALTLKEKILTNIAIDKEDFCTKGVVWISLIVTKKGKIRLLEVECDNEELQKKMEDGIHQIKRWKPGRTDGKKVDTYVYTYLILE